MMKRTCVAMVAGLLAVGTLSIPATAITVTLNPNSSSIPVVGSSAPVDVRANDDTTGVSAFSLGITFDPTIVHISNVVAGALLNANPACTLFQATPDNVNGKLCILTACSMPLSGSGNLASITFQGQGVGSTNLLFSPNGCAGQGPPPGGCQFNEGSPACTPVPGSISVLAPAPTPTPSPIPTRTNTPATAVLLGSVVLQGRPAPPNPRWSVPLRLGLLPQGGGSVLTCTPMTDQSGTFSCGPALTGTYTACVKHSHTLQNCQSVTLTAGTNAVNFGTLREGDANDDNCVLLVDFSILVSSFGKCVGDAGFDARADFDVSGCAVLADFSLLATNLGQCGATF